MVQKIYINRIFIYFGKSFQKEKKKKEGQGENERQDLGNMRRRVKYEENSISEK